MISARLARLLERLEQSGDSQQLGVADCLRTISGNGGEQETDEYIAACADALAEAAKNVRDQLSGLRTANNRLVGDHEQWYSDWQDEVAAGDTRLGFVDWLWHTRDSYGEYAGDAGMSGDGDTDAAGGAP